MVVVDVAVVVVVAGAAEVVVVEDVVFGDSDASGSSDGAEESTEVELVLPVALVLIVVLGVAAVTAGSDASSAPSTDGETCSSATLSVASVVIAFSDCVVVTVTPPAPAAIVAGLLSLPDEQATANRAIIKNAAVDAGFESVIANLLL